MCVLENENNDQDEKNDTNQRMYSIPYPTRCEKPNILS